MSCPLLTLLKQRSIRDIKKNITVGVDPYFVTNNSVVFEYYLAGHAKQYELKFPDAAEVLYHRGLITDYLDSGGRTKIFRNVLHTFTLRTGEPTQLVEEVEVSFSELALTADDVIHIVAHFEYDVTGGFMGLSEPKQRTPVRRMATGKSKGVPPVPGQTKVIEFKNRKAA